MLAVAALFGCGASLLAQPPKPPAKPPITEEQEPTIKVDVDVVNLFFSVRDRKGGYIGNLTKDDFQVTEDGKQQEIRFFSKETDLPLTLGLLVDVSRSMESLLEIERSASNRFFERVLRQKDMAFLISFGSDSELLQDSTNSTSLLKKALDELRISGGVTGVITPSTLPSTPRGTVLYDAVYLAAREKLRHEVGRKAMIIISDGMDMGSRVKLQEAIDEAHRADAIIYGILYEDPRYVMMGGSGSGTLKRMAEDTGGRMFRIDRRESLDQIYDQIQQELRSQYTLAYTPTNTARDGGFRKVEIKVKNNKDARVQARKGYFASKE